MNICFIYRTTFLVRSIISDKKGRAEAEEKTTHRDASRLSSLSLYGARRPHSFPQNTMAMNAKYEGRIFWHQRPTRSPDVRGSSPTTDHDTNAQTEGNASDNRNNTHEKEDLYINGGKIDPKDKNGAQRHLVSNSAAAGLPKGIEGFMRLETDLIGKLSINSTRNSDAPTYADIVSKKMVNFKPPERQKGNLAAIPNFELLLPETLLLVLRIPRSKLRVKRYSVPLDEALNPDALSRHFIRGTSLTPDLAIQASQSRRKRKGSGEEVMYNTVFSEVDSLCLLAFPSAMGILGREERLVSIRPLPAWQCFLDERGEWKAGWPGAGLHAVFLLNGHLDKDRIIRQFRANFKKYSMSLRNQTEDKEGGMGPRGLL